MLFSAACVLDHVSLEGGLSFVVLFDVAYVAAARVVEVFAVASVETDLVGDMLGSCLLSFPWAARVCSSIISLWQFVAVFVCAFVGCSS